MTFDTRKEREYAESSFNLNRDRGALLQRCENLAAALLRACDEIETQRMTLRTIHLESGAAGRYSADESDAELPGSHVRSRPSTELFGANINQTLDVS